MKSLKKKIVPLCLIVGSVLAIQLLLCSCAPKQVDSNDLAETGESYAEDFTWTADANCSACHAKEADLSVTTQAGYHLGELGNNCTNCHNDDAALADAHDGVDGSAKPPKRLKSTEVSQETCLGCHGSLDSLAQKTAGSTALTDDKGKVVNPHDLPENASHEGVACASCHTMHEETVVGDRAKVYCISCHHENVYECGTCHAQ